MTFWICVGKRGVKHWTCSPKYLHSGRQMYGAASYWALLHVNTWYLWQLWLRWALLWFASEDIRENVETCLLMSIIGAFLPFQWVDLQWCSIEAVRLTPPVITAEVRHLYWSRQQHGMCQGKLIWDMTAFLSRLQFFMMKVHVLNILWHMVSQIYLPGWAHLKWWLISS